MAPNRQSLAADETISAEVLLRSESGRQIAPDTAITADNVAEFSPSDETVRRAVAAFETAGFTASLPAGLGFSITGSAALFESVFAARLSRDESDGILATEPGGAETRELPLNALAPALQGLLVAVTFSEPPAFGPGNF